MSKGCNFCKRKEPLNDTANSNFAVTLDRDEGNYYIEVEYDDSYVSDNGCTYINYCPMCGRDLEAIE